MRNIMVLVPSRERPHNARRLAESLYADGVDYKICVDSNDPRLDEYIELIPEKDLLVGEPNKLGPWLNAAARLYTGDYRIIGFLGDDVIPRTPNWNVEVFKSFRPNAVIYPNDGFQGEALPTSVFMDSRIIDRTGYMVYPELTHLYIDNHWKALGEGLGTLTYLGHVHLEHMHPFAGKAEDDNVYRTANSPEMYSKDRAAFDRYVNEILEWDVKKCQ